MLVRKITHGFVTQVFDTKTKAFVSQEFTAGDLVEFETVTGAAVDDDEVTEYLPFDMVQPKDMQNQES